MHLMLKYFNFDRNIRNNIIELNIKIIFDCFFHIDIMCFCIIKHISMNKILPCSSSYSFLDFSHGSLEGTSCLGVKKILFLIGTDVNLTSNFTALLLSWTCQ